MVIELFALAGRRSAGPEIVAIGWGAEYYQPTGLTLTGRLRVARRKPLDAMAQTEAHAANVQSIPIIEAAMPISSPPKDHNPLSMKNKLSTRPKRLGGVST